MPVLPPALLLAAGVVGAVALVRIIRREYRRVNDELERARAAPVAREAERPQHPTLRRDPRTGVYRPDR
jgi:hypothetical protein